MKTVFVILLAAPMMIAQTPSTKPAAAAVPAATAAAPKLSTADQVALTALEKVKQSAQATFSEAQKNELTVIQEWNAAHPGFYIDQQTFAVTASKKEDDPKSPAWKKWQAPEGK